MRAPSQLSGRGNVLGKNQKSLKLRTRAALGSYLAEQLEKRLLLAHAPVPVTPPDIYISGVAQVTSPSTASAGQPFVVTTNSSFPLTVGVSFATSSASVDGTPTTADAGYPSLYDFYVGPGSSPQPEPDDGGAVNVPAGSHTITFFMPDKAPDAYNIAQYDDAGNIVAYQGPWVTAAGSYFGNPFSTSHPFVLQGNDPLSLLIRSRSSGKNPNEASPGEIVSYTLTMSSKEPVKSAQITDTLPAGFVPMDISAKGTFDGSSITWNTLDRVVSFRVKVPDASVLNGLTQIVDNGSYTATFKDDSFDTRTATNTMNLASKFKIEGVLHDATFQFPNRLTVGTRALLGGVTVNLLDGSGNVVSTATTKFNGKFEVNAPMPGDYTIEFTTLADRYLSPNNAIDNQHVFVGQLVPVLPSDTKPVDLGNVYLPKTFFATAAKTLQKLNNYTTSEFQNLREENVDLFQFDTTGAEAILTTLAGTQTTPTPLLDAKSLQAGGGSADQWVSAMRMIAGLSDVDMRFRDCLGLADSTGKAISIIASAAFSKFLGQKLGALQKQLPTQPKWYPLGQNTTTFEQYKAIQGDRVAAFVTVGNLLPQALDKFGASPQTKNYVMAIVFNIARYVSDFFTGKLIDDLSFELVFNVIRIAMDAAVLETFTGVKLRTDVTFPWNLVAPAVNFVQSLALTFNGLQGVIDQSVKNWPNYNTATGTDQVLTALDDFNVQQKKTALKFQVATSTFAGLFSFFRGETGVLELYKLAGQQASGKVQTGIQNILTRFNTALTNVTKLTPAQFQTGALISTIASTLVGLAQQGISAQSIVPIEQNGTAQASPQVILASGALSPTLAPPKDSADRSAPSKAAPASAATYDADLHQLSGLVSAANVDGITTLFPKLQSDDQDFFNNHLAPLDNQISQLELKVNPAQQRILQRFDGAVQAAINATLLMYLQLDFWGSNPSTGDPKAVKNQIAATIQAINTAAQQIPTVQALLSGRPLPATLEIDESSIPSQLSAGTTQPFTFNVTNIGSQPSVAGTISFTNGDGTLVVQGPASQTLPALAPGASMMFTWQVTAVAPTSTNLGSVFQVNTLTGNQAASITDQVQVSS